MSRYLPDSNKQTNKQLWKEKKNNKKEKLIWKKQIKIGALGKGKVVVSGIEVSVFMSIDYDEAHVIGT